jgi:hypothetical protein
MMEHLGQQCNSMNTARTRLAGAGIQTLALAFGGSTPTVSSATEQYDGATWNTVTSMATARNYLGGAGTAIAALGFGGSDSGKTAATEEYNSIIMSINTAAWSSGGNLNTSRNGMAGIGTQTAAVGAGGYSPPTIVGSVEEYNGFSWTTNPVSLINARFNVGAAGTQTAACFCRS